MIRPHHRLSCHFFKNTTASLSFCILCDFTGIVLEHHQAYFNTFRVPVFFFLYKLHDSDMSFYLSLRFAYSWTFLSRVRKLHTTGMMSNSCLSFTTLVHIQYMLHNTPSAFSFISPPLVTKKKLTSVFFCVHSEMPWDGANALPNYTKGFFLLATARTSQCGALCLLLARNLRLQFYSQSEGVAMADFGQGAVAWCFFGICWLIPVAVFTWLKNE